MLMVLVAGCSLKSLFFVTYLLIITMKERLGAKGTIFPKYGTCHITITPIFTPRSSSDAKGL